MPSVEFPEYGAASVTDDQISKEVRKRFEEMWLTLEKRNMLPGLFWRLGVHSQDIPDLINETGFHACRSIGTLKSWDDFDKWVIGIAKNIYRRYCRDAASRNRKQEKVTSVFRTEQEFDIEDSISGRIILEDCLRKLDKSEQLIVSYRVVLGYKWDEIAGIVGKPRSSVARYYERAIEKLRVCIQVASRG